MVTISGVRGVVGETLTPELIVKYIQSFATVVEGKKIVLGSDSRVSGPFVKQVVIGTLLAKGCDVIDIGIVPTPTVQLLTMQLKADAGLVLTASHNPIEWNGLKFIDRDGLFFSPNKCEQLFKNAEKSSEYSKWPSLGTLNMYSKANADHIQTILNLPYIDIERVRAKKYRIALDTINGAGCEIMVDLLEQLGCEVLPINNEATGIFAHTPEPIPENLTQLSKHVIQTKADFGIAVDPDVDRCVLINELGQPLGEEYTLAIVTKFILSKKLGMVVKNMSTTMALDEIASYYNCQVYEAAVGEINVVIGGEGNGGIMLPEIHIGRDAPVAAALVLAALTESDCTISELKASLPQYEIVKKKVTIEGKNPDQIINQIATQFANSKTSQIDGLKIYGDKWWVHLRKSNTEPIMRIIAESKTVSQSDEICNRFITLIDEAAV